VLLLSNPTQPNPTQSNPTQSNPIQPKHDVGHGSDVNLLAKLSGQRHVKNESSETSIRIHGLASISNHFCISMDEGQMISPISEQSRCQITYYQHPLDAYEVKALEFHRFAKPEALLGRTAGKNQHCGFVQATAFTPLFIPYWGCDAGQLLMRPSSRAAPPTPPAPGADSEDDDLGPDVEQCNEEADNGSGIGTLTELLRGKGDSHLNVNE
jgi:hypothetical protein